MGHGTVLKGIVKYYGRGKNIPHTFGYTGLHHELRDTAHSKEGLFGPRPKWMQAE